ncbi:MAG TPA: cytochrome ubiquinol oxidase subunit I [Gemmatimonadales bacterium]|nr:cytochrome ubiquinol oxidase subunit I [Gemmatimonadales bacterium]
MSDLFAARSQMAISLAFHILFAVVGIGMPLLMVVAERRWLATKDPIDLELAKRWSKGTAILFAVGAVSGTVLSFELGLLWPGFMELAGPLIGLPFSLEGFAFFTEAIFLGIYLYGWDRIPPRAHLLAGVMVAVSGAVSGIFVVLVNAWMNAPTGFELVNGAITNIDPIKALQSPAAFQQTLHMTLAAYAATGFAVAGIHALLLLREPMNTFHRRALAIALLVGAPAALLQPISGDISARNVARYQPAKLAAMEALFETRRSAPLLLGGWPDMETRTVRYGIEIPAGLSLLAAHDPDAEIAGLDQFPREDWPHVPTVHVAFQVMVGLGTAMALVALWVIWTVARRRQIAEHPLLLKALAVCAPFGFIAIEAGWTVTEVGRQPWVVHGVLRTADAVTPMPGLTYTLAGFTLLYVLLGIVVVWMLYSQIIKSPRDQDWHRIYSPAAATRPATEAR